MVQVMTSPRLESRGDVSGLRTNDGRRPHDFVNDLFADLAGLQPNVETVHLPGESDSVGMNIDPVDPTCEVIALVGRKMRRRPALARERPEVIRHSMGSTDDRRARVAIELVPGFLHD
jgi:hypothetical protein